jgi:hypothetical protein
LAKAIWGAIVNRQLKQTAIKYNMLTTNIVVINLIHNS